MEPEEALFCVRWLGASCGLTVAWLTAQPWSIQAEVFRAASDRAMLSMLGRRPC